MTDISLDWLVSVDDHVLEPPHVWQDRLPAKFKEAGPRIVNGAGAVKDVFVDPQPITDRPLDDRRALVEFTPGFRGRDRRREVPCEASKAERQPGDQPGAGRARAEEPAPRDHAKGRGQPRHAVSR